MTPNLHPARSERADGSRPTLSDRMTRTLAEAADAISARLWALEYASHERRYWPDQENKNR